MFILGGYLNILYINPSLNDSGFCVILFMEKDKKNLFTSDGKLMTDELKCNTQLQIGESVSFIVIIYTNMGERLLTGI